MSKRIGALKWDEECWEGEGHSVEAATSLAVAEYRRHLEAICGPAMMKNQIDVRFDLFAQVLVPGNGGQLIYRVILRKY